MELLGIRFAPLHVPLERRLQTLSAAIWFIIMAFGGLIGLLLAIYLVLFTKFWWLTLLYLTYIWTIDKDVSERGGRPSKWVRSFLIWKYTMNYFPLKLEKTSSEELDPKKNYLFCCFPHGMLCTGSFNFGNEYSKFRNLFPNHEPRVVTLTQHYQMPFFREFALSLGGISASFESIHNVLSRPEGGYICVLMVGGAAEAYLCKPGSYRVLVKKRKGFIKLALKNGTPLVPVLSFGETDLFDQLEGSWLRIIQERIRKYIGVAPILPIGRGFFQYSFGIIPRRHPVTTVVGQPLEVPKIDNPTTEQIEEYHEKFLKHLTAMFEEQKYKYLENPQEKQLIAE
ncbi:2-acylglycerol O-acyltransferase 2-like isoform X2 [Diorhabda carinulata]|nr:2-acylglycerol O-acyltransferase 2-like [Diorhabda sublineata]XP_056632412.1 2-acylglycerol O-acyltransferase 2-like [Diorhabda sublineata]XP_056632413.1 2-acylglycerol O-acyltransferase 2-like [Diorhabda sublineata]XP_057665392.1 2-acylglycerol O-acyltransferase 2-like isoform X2 [Diorhabda carinulata]XP_057665393.1 2-acylglycerol O-acyltransferase 2-like isoform X2 [Diorhabda carinulata]